MHTDRRQVNRARLTAPSGHTRTKRATSTDAAPVRSFTRSASPAMLVTLRRSVPTVRIIPRYRDADCFLAVGEGGDPDKDLFDAIHLPDLWSN